MIEWHSLLMCGLDRIEIDELEVRIYLPPRSSVDGPGVVLLAQACNPNVAAIQVFSLGRKGVLYVERADGTWARGVQVETSARERASHTLPEIEVQESIKVGELFFGREGAEDPFPFGAEFSFTAFTIFGTRYELRWGNREIDESALKATSGGGRELTNKAYSSLVSKWGEPGTGDRWRASYFVGDVDEDVAEGVSLDEAMVVCSHHYRQMLMTAMAEVGVLVAGLPMLPPEGSADFSEDDVENWTPAGD